MGKKGKHLGPQCLLIADRVVVWSTLKKCKNKHGGKSGLILELDCRRKKVGWIRRMRPQTGGGETQALGLMITVDSGGPPMRGPKTTTTKGPR